MARGWLTVRINDGPDNEGQMEVISDSTSSACLTTSLLLGTTHDTFVT